MDESAIRALAKHQWVSVFVSISIRKIPVTNGLFAEVEELSDGFGTTYVANIHLAALGDLLRARFFQQRQLGIQGAMESFVKGRKGEVRQQLKEQ